jgi:diaminopimelate epimerase
MRTIYKYHGLGNDFVVIEAAGPNADGEDVRRICDRHRGVGGDGVILVAPSGRPEADARMVIYNRDGSRPEMCGNGIRCLARHLAEVRGSDRPLVIESDAGLKQCRFPSTDAGRWQVSVNMGRAEHATQPVEFECRGERRRFESVDVGNPHAVTFGTAPIETVDAFGEAMNDPQAGVFADGVNVEFVERLDATTLQVVVFERGVGRTEACGTGACATAVAAWETGRADDGPVDVHLPGGVLTIERD